MSRKPVVQSSQAEKKAKMALAKAKEAAEKEAAAQALLKKQANEEREKLLAKAGPDRQIKTAIASLTKALWRYELTAQQRIDIKAKIAAYEKDLSGMAYTEAKKEDIDASIAFISSAPELVEIMRLLWVCMLPHLEDGKVNHSAYVRLMTSMQFALNGNPDEAAALKIIEGNWERDIRSYRGCIDQVAFFDIVFHIVTGWLDVFDPMAYTTFIWSLTSSIFDLSDYPPKMNTKRFVKCITQSESEGSMMQSWFVSRSQIADTIKRAVVSASTVRTLRTGTGDGTTPAVYDMNVSRDLVKKFTYKDGDSARWDIAEDENMKSLLRMQARTAGRVQLSGNDAAIVQALAMTAAREKEKQKRLASELGGNGGNGGNGGGGDIGDENTDSDEDDDSSVGRDQADVLTDSLSTDLMAGRGRGSADDDDGRSALFSRIASRESKWLDGRQDISYNYKAPTFERIKRSKNWIGDLKGNIFFNRGQHMQSKDSVAGSFTSFLHSWIRDMELGGEHQVTYEMFANVKRCWLNERSRINQASSLQARMDEDREHLDRLHKKSQGLAIGGSGSGSGSSYTSKVLGRETQGSAFGLQEQQKAQQEAEADRIRMSVNEVMDLIRHLQPKSTYGESIPAPHQYSRIPDIVLTGSGEIAVEEQIPFTPSDYKYAPTYVYHSPNHYHSTQRMLGSLRPSEPLRSILDGGGNHAGTSQGSQCGSHFQYGSHIDANASVGSSFSLTLGRMSQSKAHTSSVTTSLGVGGVGAFSPMRKAPRRGPSGIAVGSVGSLSGSGGGGGGGGVSSILGCDGDDMSQWSALLPSSVSGGGSINYSVSGSSAGGPFATYNRRRSPFQANAAVAAAIGAGAGSHAHTHTASFDHLDNSEAKSAAAAAAAREDKRRLALQRHVFNRVKRAQAALREKEEVAGGESGHLREQQQQLPDYGWHSQSQRNQFEEFGDNDQDQDQDQSRGYCLDWAALEWGGGEEGEEGEGEGGGRLNDDDAAAAAGAGAGAGAGAVAQAQAPPPSHRTGGDSSHRGAMPSSPVVGAGEVCTSDATATAAANESNVSSSSSNIEFSSASSSSSSDKNLTITMTLPGPEPISLLRQSKVAESLSPTPTPTPGPLLDGREREKEREREFGQDMDDTSVHSLHSMHSMHSAGTARTILSSVGVGAGAGAGAGYGYGPQSNSGSGSGSGSASASGSQWGSSLHSHSHSHSHSLSQSQSLSQSLSLGRGLATLREVELMEEALAQRDRMLRKARKTNMQLLQAAGGQSLRSLLPSKVATTTAMPMPMAMQRTVLPGGAMRVGGLDQGDDGASAGGDSLGSLTVDSAGAGAGAGAGGASHHRHSSKSKSTNKDKDKDKDTAGRDRDRDRDRDREKRELRGTGGREYRFMDPQDIFEEKVWVSQRALSYEEEKKWK